MKFPIIFFATIFCFSNLKSTAQSDALMAEHNRIFSNIMSFNITEADRIGQIEHYLPPIYFKQNSYGILSAAVGTRSISFINYILSKPGINAAELAPTTNESILYNLPWDDYKIVKAGTCIKADTLGALHKQITQLLISKGASLLQIDANGNNVISRAVANSDIEFLEFIYEKNGNKLIGVPNLLYTGCSYGCVDVVKWLVDHGENVNAQNSYEGSAIGSSVSKPAIVRYLISKGANVNQTNNYKWSPLMYAANRGNIETVQLLLDAGADINAINNKGWNALQVAKEYKQKEIAKLLKKKMEGK
jgi:Ankyrin repeats (3 copies)